MNLEYEYKKNRNVIYRPIISNILDCKWLQNEVQLGCMYRNMLRQTSRSKIPSCEQGRLNGMLYHKRFQDYRRKG